MALPALVPSDNLLGNYRIVSRLGAGGMGVVYKAFDEKLQRIVALKFLAGSELSLADRNRVLREARAASALDHENIASIHAVEEAPDGRLFIVMGFYEGENLATRMSQAPLTIDQAVSVVRQIAQGLAHAHAHNVIHRDIKPSNAILGYDGVAKIVDFGLARAINGETTQSTGVSGTLPYMSPEQVTGKSVDHRTDIWSLGVMMYELVAHRHPFLAESPAGTVAAVAKGQPAPMDNVPEALQAIVYRAMAKRPENRYQSCAEMLRDLRMFEASRAGATVTVDTGDLDRRIRSAGGDERSGLRRGTWLTISAAIAVVAAALIIIPMFRDVQIAWNGHEKIIVKSSPAASEQYQRGMEHLKRYDKPEQLLAAIRTFEATIATDPNFALAYAALGEAYLDKYRLDQNPDWMKRATEYSQQAMRLNQELPDVYVTLGRLHDLNGEHDLALQEILKAVKLDPYDAKAYLALGDAYSNVKRLSDAEQAYRRGIALRPKDWDAYQRFGFFFFRNGNYGDAAEQYRQVIAIVPDNAKAHGNLGAAVMWLAKYPEAEQEMKRSLELGPSYTVFYNLAYLYYSQKRYDESIKMTQEALHLNSQDYRVWQMLGLCYEWLGRQTEAARAYQQERVTLEKAGSLKSDDAAAQAELGLLYSKTHDVEQARRHLNTALALAPTEPRVLVAAGETYENLGDRQTALAYIQRALASGWSIEKLKQNPDLRAFLADPLVSRTLHAR